jgi:nucleoside-diphosphate-sugar epimerase
MRVFLTGATGFIGSHVLPELLARGHQVLGLTRSNAGARQLEAAGAEVHRGDLNQPETLASGVAVADAVIHCAFDHDFTNFVANTQKDVRVIGAMGEALKGSDRPLLITSGVGIGSGEHGEPAREDMFNPAHPNPRIATEIAGNALLDAGVNVSVMRLPQVHDTEKQGLITPYIDIVRANGRVAFVGDGANRWAAGHVSDVAVLYRLAIERATPGARWNAVAEEGVGARAIAEVVSRGLGLPTTAIAPEEAQAEFGWFALFASLDMPASSAITRERLGWEPRGPGLIADLEAMDYSRAG